MNDARSLYSGKRVFITGHTGFKGAWLSLWLTRLGASVHGFSLPPPTEPSIYARANLQPLLAGETIGDLRDPQALQRSVRAAAPDLVFHLAAQALVRRSYEVPEETFAVNVMGTAHLLDAVRDLAKPCAVICVTSDKCYANQEQVWGYREQDSMGGADPYSASKGAAELVIAAYRHSYFNPAALSHHGVQIASARAGNVIGGGDWARDRIVVDMVAALLKGAPVPVRNPHAVRPWQHVLDPLSGYLDLGARMLAAPDPAWCRAWNFGPLPGAELTVAQLVECSIAVWGSGSWADVGTPDQPYEAGSLRLCIDQARCQLGWTPLWDDRMAIRKTVAWYKRVLCGGDSVRSACDDDITAFGKDQQAHLQAASAFCASAAVGRANDAN